VWKVFAKGLVCSKPVQQQTTEEQTLQRSQIRVSKETGPEGRKEMVSRRESGDVP